MSDLPDIDTSQVSYLAYFNCIDQGGVQSIDPEEVTSHGAITSSTLYDNGVEGKFNMGAVCNGFNTDDGPVPCQFRVKSDGWMVVYLDQSEQYGQNILTGTDAYSFENSSPRCTYPVNDLRGWWRLDPQWSSSGYTNGGADVTRDVHKPSGTQNGLARVINALRQQLSNSGSVTFNHSDVGLYNYQYEAATATTLLASDVAVHGGGTPSAWGLSYTGSTTIEAAAICGAVQDTSTDYSIGFEGTTIADCQTGGNPQYNGVIDPIARGLIPDSETEYTHDRLRMSNNGLYGGLVVSSYLLWS